MPDRIVRIIVLGSTSDAQAKMAALAATTDVSAADMTGSMGRMTSTVGGFTSRLGSKLQALGIPFSGVLVNAGKKLDNTTTKGQKFGQAMLTTASAVTAATVVAGAGVAAFSIKAGMDLQAADASIAASEHISTKAATNIGNAFAGTAFKVQYSGTTIAQAFAGTAGQFEQINGKALTTKQSMGIMSASMNLAEATQTDLQTSTGSLAKVMQAYQIPTKGATNVTNVLFNASRVLGLGLGNIAMQIQRTATRMGVLRPPIGQVVGLLADMTHAGETGRQALSSLTQISTKIIKPSTDYVTALNKQKVLLQQIPPEYQSVAKEMAAGTITTQEFQDATKYTSESVKDQINAFKSQYDATITASNAIKEIGVNSFSAKGKFVGFGSIITQVSQHLVGLTQKGKLAYLGQIFGTNVAIKMLKVFDGGPATLRKFTEEMQRKNSAEKAAEIQEGTLKHQLETLKAGLEDVAERIGEKLIPVIERMGKAVVGIIKWFEKHKEVAIALAAALGTVLLAAIVVTIARGFMKLGKALDTGIKDMKKFAQSMMHPVQSLKQLGKTSEETSDKQVLASKKAALAGEESAATQVESGEATQLSFFETGTASTVMADETVASAGLMDAAMAAGPLLAVIAIGVAVMELVKHWRGAWTGIKEAFHVAWDEMKDVFRGAEVFLQTGWKVLFGGWELEIKTLIKVWHAAWDTMKHVVSDVWNFVKRIFDDITHAFDAIGHTFTHVLSNLNPLHFLAGGGTAQAGQSYVVGEQGPEIFTPGVTGTVTPHAQAFGGGGRGGPNITIYGYNLSDPSQTAAEIAWKMKTAPSGTA